MPNGVPHPWQLHGYHVVPPDGPTPRRRWSPIDRDKVTHIERLQLWQREGRGLASLFGIKKSFMNDFDEAELVFELGPPGQAKQVAGP
ncbi:MAG TPA: hypothetical protein VFU01_17960 [Gemmatimonadaceae bacterium]|nr:hypothetical protein [Gemmatimonadaceae bacterium]